MSVTQWSCLSFDIYLILFTEKKNMLILRNAYKQRTFIKYIYITVFTHAHTAPHIHIQNSLICCRLFPVNTQYDPLMFFKHLNIKVKVHLQHIYYTKKQNSQINIFHSIKLLLAIPLWKYWACNILNKQYTISCIKSRQDS